ncbi:MAG: hypothetical protein JXA42_11940 [Anaerolineales bacterium]|nr:hypothetical protein [Anaerolineales bacterium]
MKILGDIALVLLIVVGYSTGSVLSVKGKKITPDILDVSLVVVSWIIAFSIRLYPSKWLTWLFWIPFDIFLGALITWLRRKQFSPEKVKYTPILSSKLLAKLWDGWKRFANRLGNYQSRIWLAFIYFLLIVPFGLIMRLFMNPWKSVKTEGTAWVKRESTKTDITSARNQY